MEAINSNFRESTVFLIDNATVHKTRLMRAAYRSWGIVVISNLPYHPQLAPIEMIFHSWKKELNDRPMKGKLQFTQSIWEAGFKIYSNTIEK